MSILEEFNTVVSEEIPKIILLFGPPSIRFPHPQGWIIQNQSDNIYATLIYLEECPHCKGFHLLNTKICSSDSRYQNKLEKLATTPHLQAAYKKSQHVHIWMHSFTSYKKILKKKHLFPSNKKIPTSFPSIKSILCSTPDSEKKRHLASNYDEKI